MTVWVSTKRRGISYHLLVDGDRKTSCGRYYGTVENLRPDRGFLISTGDADLLDAVPCRRCFGIAQITAPVVGPRSEWIWDTRP